MKRWMALAAAVCLLLAPTAALGYDGVVIPDTANEYGVRTRYISVRSICAVGDTVWFAVPVEGRMQLWSWKEGQAQASEAALGLVSATSYVEAQQMADAVEAAKATELPFATDARHAVSLLFTDGEKLYGLNHHNGLIFTIAVDKGVVKCEDVVTISDNSVMYTGRDGSRWFNSPQAVAASGGWLYWNYSAMESDRSVRRVAAFSLTDGSCRVLKPEDVVGLTAYEDGQVLLVTASRKSQTEKQLLLYEPETDLALPAGTILSTDAYNVCYAPELKTLLYQEGSKIMGMQDLGEPVPYAWLPTRVSGKMAVLGDTLIFQVPTTTIARTLNRGAAAESCVRVLGASLNIGTQNFAVNYPTVPVFTDLPADEQDADAIAAALAAQEEQPDLLYTCVSAGVLRTLAERGLLADLAEVPEVKAWLDDLHPAFRNAVTVNGGVYGVPVNTASYTGFFINKKVMSNMGFTPAEMPTNLVDLCSFITMWNDEYALKHPHYCVLEYAPDTRAHMVKLTLDQWRVHCQAEGQPLHFEDPVFRQLMAALQEMRCDKLDEAMKVIDPEISDYKQGVIWNGCQLVGNWATYMEDYSDRIFIPMSLTADTPFRAQVGDMHFWAVNASAGNRDYALKYLQAQMDDVDPKYTHVLLRSETEPVVSPWYQEALESAQRDLADSQAAVENAATPEERERAEIRLARAESYMEENVTRERYSIHPTAVDNYQQVLAPALVVRQPDELTGSVHLEAIEQLMLACARGDLPVDAMIRQAEELLEIR